MYADLLVEINIPWYMLPGKQPNIVAPIKVQER